jgi:hypothetical protein
MEHPLIKKLRIKEGMKIAILNAPEGFIKNLGKLPKDVSIESGLKGTHDLVQLFVYNKTELEKMAPAAAKLLKENALFWISYPKKSAKINTDLSRDEGWKVMKEMNFEGVSLIAIDETWSAGRFKLIENKRSVQKAGAAERGAEDLKYIDQEKRLVRAPEDLKTVFAKNKVASDFFESLSFTNKKEYVRWIIEAKREETRKERVSKTVQKLSAGKKNPSDK